jgi:hypothetical protein
MPGRAVGGMQYPPRATEVCTDPAARHVAQVGNPVPVELAG